MDDLTTQIIEELDAFDPRWRIKYKSMPDAAQAARLEVLLDQWAGTEAGKRYTAQFGNVPDRVGFAKREAEAHRAPTSLPFGYDKNMGLAFGVLDGE